MSLGYSAPRSLFVVKRNTSLIINSLLLSLTRGLKWSSSAACIELRGGSIVFK